MVDGWIMLNLHIISIKSPLITIKSPLITIKSPLITINSPLITIKSPLITIKSPLITIKCHISWIFSHQAVVTNPESWWLIFQEFAQMAVAILENKCPSRMLGVVRLVHVTTLGGSYILKSPEDPRSVWLRISIGTMNVCFFCKEWNPLKRVQSIALPGMLLSDENRQGHEKDPKRCHFSQLSVASYPSQVYEWWEHPHRCRNPHGQAIALAPAGRFPWAAGVWPSAQSTSHRRRSRRRALRAQRESTCGAPSGSRWFQCPGSGKRSLLESGIMAPPAPRAIICLLGIPTILKWVGFFWILLSSMNVKYCNCKTVRLMF